MSTCVRCKNDIDPLEDYIWIMISVILHTVNETPIMGSDEKKQSINIFVQNVGKL
jgi:hypothetical protein